MLHASLSCVTGSESAVVSTHQTWHAVISSRASPERTDLPPSNWRPRGLLVAHLHEHRGPINRLLGIFLEN
ncbi:hypothetical protein DPMN_127287 [Dreissena polymorpha]|uniref:Uncharacterized protein n=1 Tax=Dreissena polymorpha TaxID=45954 RepID=A0A9D4JYP5_DREPO|nr:hypothetical protein DPMN_127287 [Dreissena polymorpha]